MVEDAVTLPLVEHQGCVRVSLFTSNQDLGAGQTRFSDLAPCETMVRVIGTVKAAQAGELWVEQANDATGVYFPVKTPHNFVADTPVPVELLLHHPFVRARLVNSGAVTITGLLVDLWLLPV